MSEHLVSQPFGELIEQNKKIVFPEKNSSTQSPFVGKLRYYYGWLVAAALVLFVATPLLVYYRFRHDRENFYKWCDWGARAWLRACGARVKVRGLENLEANRSYVFASNHRSYLDTATLYAYAGKRVGLVAKKELLKVPIFGYGMGLANVIAIDRSNPERARKSMEKAREVLESGYSFGVFAEGTRAMPGELLPFKKGAFHLALQTGAPVVPVAIKNTDWMMGKRAAVARSGTIEMVLLPPIETSGLSPETDLMELLKQTRAAIAAELNK
jgi:1-acyl-sn-glycerol-3-phosphate acyltransferase